MRVLLAVVFGLATCQIALLLTTLYLHRALSHRALSLSPGVAFACRVLVWISTGVRPRQWVAVHRKHHAFTDVDGDPHSPLLEGFSMVQFLNFVLYRRVARQEEVVRKYARDLPADAWDRRLFDHALLGLGIGFALFVLILGWEMALVAAAVHAVSYLLLNAAINAIGHSWGRRPYPNIATNNQWLAFLTMGEGLHNNHHAAPTSARLSLARREIDPGWWVIATLRRLGWAKVRHTEVKLAHPKAPAAA